MKWCHVASLNSIVFGLSLALSLYKGLSKCQVGVEEIVIKTRAVIIFFTMQSSECRRT